MSSITSSSHSASFILMSSPSSSSLTSSAFTRTSSSSGSLSSLTEAIAASPPSLKVCRSPNSLRSYLSFCLQGSESDEDEDGAEEEDSEWDELSIEDGDGGQWMMPCDLKPLNMFEFFSSAISISSSTTVAVTSVAVSAAALESPIDALDDKEDFLVCSDENDGDGKIDDQAAAKLKMMAIAEANRRWAEVVVASDEKDEEEEEEEMIFSLELSADQEEEEELSKKPSLLHQNQQKRSKPTVVCFDLEHIEEFLVPVEDDCRRQDWVLAAVDRWRTGQLISSILGAEHRERIYMERFASSQTEDDN